jgi:hypothetical protein
LGEGWEKRYSQVCSSSLCYTMLKDDDGIVAFSFHRDFTVDNYQSPPEYLQGLPETFLKRVERKIHFKSIEWLTVAPQHLGRFTKVQPGDLIMGLGITFMKNSIFDATIGFSRQDTKVDKLSTRFGSELCGTVDKFGIPCSIVLVESHRVVPHPISRVQEKLDQLWSGRTNELTHLERRQAA